MDFNFQLSLKIEISSIWESVELKQNSGEVAEVYTNAWKQIVYFKFSYSVLHGQYAHK